MAVFGSSFSGIGSREMRKWGGQRRPHENQSLIQNHFICCCRVRPLDSARVHLYDVGMDQ